MRPRWRRSRSSASSRRTGPPPASPESSAIRSGMTVGISASAGWRWAWARAGKAAAAVIPARVTALSRRGQHQPTGFSADKAPPAPPAGRARRGRAPPAHPARGVAGGPGRRAGPAGRTAAARPRAGRAPRARSSSEARTWAARVSTARGTPASLATCRPQLRSAVPGPTACRKTTSPFHSRTRIVAGVISGSLPASAVSSWKWVAKMVRQRVRSCSASSAAQAMASPSQVAVPRPTSSSTTRDAGRPGSGWRRSRPSRP